MIRLQKQFPTIYLAVYCNKMMNIQVVVFSILLILTLLSSISGYGQLTVGPVAGFRYGKVIYDDRYSGEPLDVRWKPDYSAGLVVNYAASDLMALNAELLYGQRGKKVFSQTAVELSHITGRYQFLEVPALLQFRVLQPGSARTWFINVGPRASYWLGGEGEVVAYQSGGREGTFELPYTINFKGRTAPARNQLSISSPKPLQFSIDVGFGSYWKYRKNRSIMAEIRASYFTTFLAEDGAVPIGISGFNDYFLFRSLYLEFRMAYLFNLDLHELMRGKSRGAPRY